MTAPDLHRLFWALREHDELQRFAHRRLGPLLEHDRRRKAKLLPTLEAYLAHGGRKAETARALHLERQSLYHRLGRIQELLDEDLDDEDVRLGLHVALRALRYAEDAERTRGSDRRPPGPPPEHCCGTLRLPRPGRGRSGAPRCWRP